MPSQNFRVKNGLEVGTDVTISAGIITATSIRVSGDIQTGAGSSFSQLNVSGVSTLGNTVVGGGTTQLVVSGDARITGILTIGTSSITLNGSQNQVNVGSGVTIHHTNGVLLGSTRLHSAGLDVDEIKVGTGITIRAGIISATEFRGNGSFLTGVTPFSSGTLMLFQQTAAPTGWTKQTTHNDKTLRVVSGSASSGGTTAFTSVFTSRAVSGSVNNTTLSTAQMPSHSHTITTNYSFYSGGRVTSSDGSYSNHTGGTNSEGSSNAHNHGFTGTAMDFDVQYVDLIIASKD